MTAVDPLTDVRDTYLRMRQVQRALNEQILGEMGQAGIEDSARALGFWSKGVMIFDGEDEVHLLADFAIHEHKAGRSAIEKRLASAAVSVDERVVLTAMLRSWFTIVGVTDIVPDVGVRALDLLSEEAFLLADMSLSETARRGINMVTHLLRFETFVMTSGAALPLDPDLTRRVLTGMRARSVSPEQLAALPRDARARLVANLIDLARRRPQTVRSVVSATESGQGFLPWQSLRAMPSERRGPKVGRNDPCPCGSGRKFKRCCLGAAQDKA